MAAPARAEISGLAIVQDDASLRIGSRTVHLFGVYIPPTNRDCRTDTSPARCGSRAALALDFKIQGFVTCEEVADLPGNELVGVCRLGVSSFSEGVDLAAYLIEQGWALATPEAPFAYQALEKIARSQGRGVWGFQVDEIR